jgi:hypothetical protein
MNEPHEVKQEMIKPTTLALFEGSLGAVWGLALALVVFFQATAFGSVITDSFLQGLVFGLSSSAAVLVAVPLVYFAIGWVLGYVHALVFNALKQTAENAVLRSEKDVSVTGTNEEAAETSEAPSQAFGSSQPSFGERIPERPRRRKRL